MPSNNTNPLLEYEKSTVNERIVRRADRILLFNRLEILWEETNEKKIEIIPTIIKSI